jgi:hypothetical protein
MEVVLQSHENESSGQGSGELFSFLAIGSGFDRHIASGSSNEEDASRQLPSGPVGYSVDTNVSSTRLANNTSISAEIKGLSKKHCFSVIFMPI